MGRAILRAAVIGAGTMGMSVAQWLAFSGVGVTLKSGRDEARQTFKESVEKFYERKVRRGKVADDEALAVMASCRGTREFDGFEDAGVVFECAIEDMETKRAIFRDIDRICPDHTVLSTNTSSLLVSEIASATEHPERVVGIHFFQPVRFTRVVEVIPGRMTSAETLRQASHIISGLGKTPIRIKECPGFLVNRILGVCLMEAMPLVEEHQATPDDLDRT